MRFMLIASLAVLILYFVQAGMALPATVLFILLLVDIVGGYVSAFLSFIWAVISGVVDTGKSEFDELEKADTKYPSGKKFFEEGLSRTGKALGKGEALKAQGKKAVEKRQGPEVVHAAVSDLLNGIGKLMKK